MNDKAKRAHAQPGGALPADLRALLTQREHNTTDVHRFKLQNGMRVWLHQRPRSGTLALIMQIPVGARHETNRNNGIAHFVEHMVFTGTARWPEEQEVQEVIYRAGGHANAFVNRDETVFYLHLKADDLDLGLEWLSEVLFRPTLSEAKFAKERDVIMQEKGGEAGRLGWFLEWLENRNLGYDVFWAMRRRLFPDAAMLRPVIGTDKSLRRIDYKKVVAFYRRHYIPNNMTLIAVGDVELDSFRDAVEAHLGTFPPGARPAKPKPIKINPRPFSVRLHGPNINERGQMLLGSLTGGLNDPDRYALWVLCEILEHELTEAIRHQRGLVYAIHPNAAFFDDAGFLYIYTTADTEKFGEIQAVIEAHLQRFIDGEITEAQVEAAKATIRGQVMLELESNMSMGWWLSSDAVLVQDDEAEPVPNYFAGIAAVTVDDIQRVARQYLTPERRFRVVHRPALTPRRLRPAFLGVSLTLVSAAAALAWRYRRRLGLWWL